MKIQSAPDADLHGLKGDTERRYCGSEYLRCVSDLGCGGLLPKFSCGCLPDAQFRFVTSRREHPDQEVG